MGGGGGEIARIFVFQQILIIFGTIYFFDLLNPNLKTDLRNSENYPLPRWGGGMGGQIFNFFVSQQILMRFGTS